MASLAEKVATFASVTGIEDQSLSRRILKVCVFSVVVVVVVVVVSKFRPHAFSFIDINTRSAIASSLLIILTI